MSGPTPTGPAQPGRFVPPGGRPPGDRAGRVRHRCRPPRRARVDPAVRCRAATCCRSPPWPGRSRSSGWCSARSRCRWRSRCATTWSSGPSWPQAVSTQQDLEQQRDELQARKIGAAGSRLHRRRGAPPAAVRDARATPCSSCTRPPSADARRRPRRASAASDQPWYSNLWAHPGRERHRRSDRPVLAAGQRRRPGAADPRTRAARRAVCWPSPTAATTACPRSCRPRRGCRTAPRSRPCSTCAARR